MKSAGLHQPDDSMDGCVGRVDDYGSGGSNPLQLFEKRQLTIPIRQRKAGHDSVKLFGFKTAEGI